MKNIVKIKRALISVSDKLLLENLLPFLSEYKIEIISSGKTYKKIKKLGFKSIEISNFTGSNEILGGRVKTLHPKIHAGILNIRNNKNHRLDLIKNNFKEIDLVIVNFYPFEDVIKKNINFKPSIICTGAAIAFLTKRQAPINDTLDKFYLGWFVRTLYNPRKFFIRIIKSLYLIKQFIVD